VLSKLWPIPKDLNATGRTFFRKAGQHLLEQGRLVDADYFGFVLLCRLHQQVEELSLIIGREGYTMPGRAKATLKVRHPLTSVFKSVLAEYVGLMKDFDLLPTPNRKINDFDDSMLRIV